MRRAAWILWGMSACADAVTEVPRAGRGEDASAADGDEDALVGALPGPAAEPGEVAYTLGVEDAPPVPLRLDMTRDEVRELLGPVAQEILLLELEPWPFLRNALNAIKSACGEGWKLDATDPGHDCDLTPTGRAFSENGAHWRDTPEYALVRLLTMTPANSDVRGTSIAFLQAVSDLLDLGGGFAQMLSDNLQIRRTEEFLDTEVVVRALYEGFLGTHPNIGPNGGLPFTLEDALSDLASLSTRLGPVAGHPGIVAAGFQPSGQVLGPDFRMRVTAESNVRLYEGLNLRAGVGQLSVLDDRTPPTFEDPLEFEFRDPTRFELVGLVDTPVIDLQFALPENPQWVPACAGEDFCQQNLPEVPVGPDSVWSNPRWQLESIIGAAGYFKYSALRGYSEYVGGLATVEAGQGDDPPGWMHFGVPFNLGPKDQYAWELILEVAQVGLHGPDAENFAEGDAGVRFTLTDVPVGLSGAQAAEAVRPYLQAQSARLAEILLGDFRARSDRVDFTLRRIESGALALFFVSPEDLGPGDAYPWVAPGFFLGPERLPGQKVSLTNVAGSNDLNHEKLVLGPEEQTVYVSDAKGAVFRLRVATDPTDARRARIAVREVGQ